MPKTADKSHLWETGRFPPLASSAGLPSEAPENRPAQTLAESDVGKILSDLNRAKVAFQLRTICAVLGVK